MASTRLMKIERLVQKDLSDIFQQKSRDIFQGKLITVTSVRITSDLSEAKVFLSIFPNDKAKEIIKEIEINNKIIRNELAQRVKLQLRKIPELKYYFDDSLEYTIKIDQLLKQ